MGLLSPIDQVRARQQQQQQHGGRPQRWNLAEPFDPDAPYTGEQQAQALRNIQGGYNLGGFEGAQNAYGHNQWYDIPEQARTQILGSLTDSLSRPLKRDPTTGATIQGQYET